jgi:hypothetical protein
MPGLAPTMKQQLVSAVAVLSYLGHINKYNAFFGKTRPCNSTR